jgi:hypothetical protein
MIVRWKKVDALCWVSDEWRGMIVTVQWDTARHVWTAAVQARPGAVLVATGGQAAMMNSSWPTAHQAMEAVDAAMERYVRRMILSVGMAVAHA